ncbi:MAG: hypothetical protein QOG10_3391, partial [Kribbellaceae bacterium]|nr:hypothetical protein [Kribbellaceae bacterium]
QHEEWHEAIFGVATRLVDRAREAGVIRADVDPVDLLVLVSGMASAEPARVKRLLQMVRRSVIAR